ncbi:MAG: PHP domain-containing protein [Clostridia bacterium]|nr:PHP domain-containing protein [Clostridia bacterium]
MCKEKLTKYDKLCDLHVHSHFSDGTLSPTELVELAEASGLSSIALTDHNTIGGVPEVLSAAEGSAVKAIAGVELSTDYNGVELHVLALGFGCGAYGRINELTEDYMKRKRLANKKLISDLIEAGYGISPERIYEGAMGEVNRAHIAMELVRCGYVESRKEAFDDILASGGRFYTPPKRISTPECIDFIASIGARSVLAHPFLNIDEATLRGLLSEVGDRLDGMEVIYSEYDEETTALSYKIVEEYGLLPSGGSDFHGGNKPDISLGTGRGSLRIPLSFAEGLGLI